MSGTVGSIYCRRGIGEMLWGYSEWRGTEMTGRQEDETIWNGLSERLVSPRTLPS